MLLYVKGITVLNDRVIIETSNGAQPLTPQELEVVFTPYQRGRRKSGRRVGLGLYICRKLIQLHGGKIWVETGATGNLFKFFPVPLSNQEAQS